MSDSIRVMIQMRQTAAMAVASFGPISGSPHVMGITDIPGVQFDPSFSPVPIPSKAGSHFALSMASNDAPSTYVVRASVSMESLPRLLERANENPSVVGVFSDPKIQPIGLCPPGPMGTDLDVEKLLLVDELKNRGMNGSGVRVVIVDTGFNLKYLSKHGKNPSFDDSLSWGPIAHQSLGQMPVGHGTMCAYDVCIAAPASTLIDHAVLTSQTSGESVMEGLLSDAVRSYGVLLSYMAKAPEPYAGDNIPRTLVVSNSWGMFHPSWDFPVGDPQNYSDNPAHPFNIIVNSLEAEGADILFAAGNCGKECPDNRCEDVTDAGIFGANSSDTVTCVAGVVISGERIGYSTEGPGRLTLKKPDIAAYTHFAGSGVYAADGGTSTATPVAAGVIAAIRRCYPANVLSPGKLRRILRETAIPNGTEAFDHQYGYGVINVQGILDAVDQTA